jgi:hypothetical protein
LGSSAKKRKEEKMAITRAGILGGVFANALLQELAS